MKAVFKSYFLITCLLYVPLNAMLTNTSTIIPQNFTVTSTLSYNSNNPISNHIKVEMHPTHSAQSDDNQNRAARRQQNKQNKLITSPEQYAQDLSNLINKQCVRTTSPFSFWVALQTKLALLNIKTVDNATSELQHCISLSKINELTEETIEHLHAKNEYFNTLVNMLAHQKIHDAFNITSSEIDTFFDKRKTYPSLPKNLNSFIKTKSLELLSQQFNINDSSLNALFKTSLFPSVFDETKAYNQMLYSIRYSLNTFTVNLPTTIEIKKIQHVYLSKNQLMLKILYDNNTHLMWNLIEHKEQPLIDNYVRWNRIDFNHHFNRHNVMLSVGQGKNNELFLTLVFRPTLKARLCQIALLASGIDKKQLKELNYSKTLNQLQGVVKHNFKTTIQSLFHLSTEEIENDTLSL